MKNDANSELQAKIQKLEQRVQELEQANFLYKNIIDNLPSGIQVFDEEGYSYYINDAQKQLLGLPNLEEGIGEFNVLTDSYSKAMGADKKYKKVYQGQKYEHEYEYNLGIRENQWNTHNESRIVHETIFPIKDDSNNITYVVAVLQDKTKRKKENEELIIRNRISNTFINSDSENFFKDVLDIFRNVFSSEYGYFGYINENNDLVAASMTKDIWEECQTNEKTIVFPKDSWGGLWGESLNKGKTLYRNGDLHFPQGHIHLHSAIVAPIIVNNKLIGQIALGNKEDGFDQNDRYMINSLCDYIAPLLHSKLQEEIYKKKLLDISKKAEENEAMLKAALDNSQAGIAIADVPSGRLRFVNEAGVAIPNRDYQKLVSEVDVNTYAKYWQILHFDGTPYDTDEVPLARATLYGEVCSKEFMIRRSDNEHRYVLANAAPVIDGIGKQIAAIVVFLDLTERKLAEFNLERKNEELQAAEEELRASNEELLDLNQRLEEQKEAMEKAKEKAEESDRLKSAFLANMSHEIRTPMNGIMGFIQLLSQQDYSKERQNQMLNIINTNAHHLLQIINDILDISKIEANQVKIKFQFSCLNELISDLHNIFVNELENKGKQNLIKLLVNYDFDDEQSYVKSDFHRLRQIMHNLLNNAIKFTEKGHIDFGYKLQSDNTLLFSVKDTGIGIPLEEQGNIFDRFRQINNSNKPIEGTGLGLTISKKLSELLGGDLWVDSKEGEGSIFYFTIPYIPKNSKENRTEKNVDNNENQNRQNNTILIIEDDEASQEYLKEILNSDGVNVILCSTGEEGYKAFLENSEIDLILMDVKLPDISGLEVTKRIRFNYPDRNIPIIMQTAYAMSEDFQKSIDAGCDDYISKPIDMKKLKEKINNLL